MIKAIIIIIIGAAALGTQMVYFLLDDRAPNHTTGDIKLKKRWHWAGGAIHIWMGYVIHLKYGWEYGLLMAAIIWYFFDGAINSYVLHREFWYIGNTAWLDIVQNKLADLIGIDARFMSAILKHALLITSIVFLCLKN